MMYNFACVCYGQKYSVEYVQKLYSMVTRNITLPINFIVFTDHVKMHKMVFGENLDIRQFPETDCILNRGVSLSKISVSGSRAGKSF